MPYINGKRVSNEEWTATYGSIEKLRTGPNGENPGTAPVIDEDTGVPVSKPKSKGKNKTSESKAGGKRSPRSSKAAKAAIADAMGVKDDSPELDDIDVTGADAAASDAEASDEADESNDSESDDDKEDA